MQEVPFDTKPESGWPPIPVENLWCNINNIEYEILSIPVFVSGLSRGDRILPAFVDEVVVSWEKVYSSENSTLWVFTSEISDKEDFLGRLNNLGCDTVGMDQTSLIATNVPPEVELSKIDEILKDLPDPDEDVAYPSLRHEG